MSNMLEPHLGGHKNRTHLDTGVLDFMIKHYKIKSFLDIGCGPGGMVDLATDLGLKSVGIDGDYTVKRSTNNFIIHDYTKGSTGFKGKFDLAWSCEFVEHVEEIYIPNYMKDFQRAKFVVMTFSEKPGHHHVNLKPKEYWINVFKKFGFTYNDNITTEIRKTSTMNTTGKFAHKKDFIKTHGLFFIKT